MHFIFLIFDFEIYKMIDKMIIIVDITILSLIHLNSSHKEDNTNIHILGGRVENELGTEQGYLQDL